MVKVMEVNNLCYKDFKNINILFDKGIFYSVVGGNKSGKTTLFKLLSGLLITNNSIRCDTVYLNTNNVDDYIKKIGIVERVNKNFFIYQKVYDELTYPLYNLGFSKKKRESRINDLLNYFELQDIKAKNINELTYQERQILLIILALLHKPKVLLLDGVLSVFSKEKKEFLISVLKEFIKKENMTIINFTIELNEAILTDKLLLLSNYKIIDECAPSKIFDDDKLFYQNGLEIPFTIDLSIKLKMYDLINKNYTSVKEMVDDIWP